MINFSEFNSPLQEGVNDPAIFKAIFVAGGAGSGKTFIADKTAFASMGFKLINSDRHFEKGLAKAQLEMTPENIYSDEGQAVRKRSKQTSGKELQLAIDGRLGLLVDGTGKDYSKIKKQVESYISYFTHNKKHPFLKHVASSFQYQGSWSVLLQKQGFHKNHYHSEGWISGPYYNQIPNAVEGNGEGWIEFGIPEFNMRDKLEADYVVKPKDGLLVLFPSYFWHGTRPFTTNETRMTVAFDVIPK